VRKRRQIRAGKRSNINSINLEKSGKIPKHHDKIRRISTNLKKKMPIVPKETRKIAGNWTIYH